MITCGACGAEWPDTLNFCGKCAAPLQAERSAAQERKVVTSLFCDLVAFTAMSEAADPEDVDAMLGRYFAMARAQIEAHGGVVEKFIGDAVVGVFGVPAAHEDDPERAVRAGLRICEAAEELTKADGSPLQLRVGINTGEALVSVGVVPGAGEGFLTGDAVNTAARIQSVAPVMGVAVGQGTYEATKPVFEYAELPPATVKGKSEPVAVWQAIAPLARFGTDITRRHDTPLVGREIDLALLKGVFDKTLASSSPQLVTIVGEPGLGKSRLAAELFAHIDRMPQLITWRQGRCLPYGEGITFWALGEIVKAHAGILETDPSQVALAKLDAVLPDVEERAWMKQRLLPLLGIEATSQAEQQEELFTAWRRFVESIAEADPTVVVFEDLHWADPAMLAFLEHLAGHATGVPLLIVGTARPELYERHPDYGRGLRNATPINLTPLTEDETTRLVAALLETFAVPDALRLPLVERAGGNPLFAEEYVRLLQDQDLLERVDDQVRLREGAQLPLPDNVHALIAARLDTLPPERKGLLADAAVVGKVFWAGAVAAMSGLAEAEVVEVMRDLALKELVRPVRHSAMAGQTEYTFSHALARDVAYEQLPRASRAARHIGAAKWIESEAGERVEDLADVLAYHYTTALELARAAGDDTLAGPVQPSAVRFLLLAGERALGLDAASAFSQLEKAAGLVHGNDAQRGQVLAAYGEAAQQTGRLTEAQQALEEAVTLFRAAGAVLAAVEAMETLSGVLSKRGDARGGTMSQEMLSLVHDLPVGPVHVVVHTELAVDESMQQHNSAAIEHADRALALADQLGLPVPARALGFRGSARCETGDVGGLDDFERAITLAAAAGQGRQVAVFYNNLACSLPRLRGPSAAVQVYEEGIAYCGPRGLTEISNTMAASRLEPLVSTGALDEVLHVAEQHAAVLEAADDQVELNDLRASQVRALVLRGDAEQAAGWLDLLTTSSRDMDLAEVAALGLGAAALTHSALGHRDSAVHLLAGLAGDPEACATVYAASQLPSWVRALIALNELDLADRIAAAVPALGPLGEHVHVAASAALAEARGDLATALTSYADAAQRMHDFTMYVEEAFALLGQGRCMLALDRPEDAVPVLEQARDMFTTMGARPALAETEKLLAATSS